MKSGSTSIERQSDTQAPHWMQAIVCVMSIIDSGETMYSRSGGGPSGSSHGVTRCIFFQWTASMSTIRSLMHGHVAHRLDHDRAVGRALGGLVEVHVAGEAGPAVDAHAAGAADRGAAGAADADRAVLAVLGLEDAVEHGALAVEVDR